MNKRLVTILSIAALVALIFALWIGHMVNSRTAAEAASGYPPAGGQFNIKQGMLLTAENLSRIDALDRFPKARCWKRTRRRPLIVAWSPICTRVSR